MQPLGDASATITPTACNSTTGLNASPVALRETAAGDLARSVRELRWRAVLRFDAARYRATPSLPRYLCVAVSTFTCSPILMNIGTLTTSPQANVASLYTLLL